MTGGPRFGPVVCTVRTTIRPRHAAEFARWQREEHVPGLLAVPGYLGVQSGRAIADAHQTVNLWELQSRAAFTSEAHDRASHTPWRQRIIPMRSAFEVEFFDDLTHGAWVPGPDSGEAATHLELMRLECGETDPKGALQLGTTSAHEPGVCHVRLLRNQDAPAHYLMVRYRRALPGGTAQPSIAVRSVETYERISSY